MSDSPSIHETPTRSQPSPHAIDALVRAAQGGDAAAFAQLVVRFQDTAVAYAASVLRDYDAAEDAAQDAFVDAHRLLASLREPAAFVSWLRTIVFKHCHRHHRRHRRLVALSSAGEIALTGESPLDRLERAEHHDAVRDAIGQLSAAERSVILLFYLAEEPQVTIAEFLGINVNTVKTRLYAARRKLRAIMDDMIDRDLRGARPSNDPRFVRRVIASALPVQVYSVDPFGRAVAAGATISARMAEVPSTPMWFVEPRMALDGDDWDRIVDLMRSMKIPGLAGGGQLTDHALERLAALDGLTYLDLSGSARVTDRGLAHLSRCRQLEHLDVSGTSVSDTGLSVLQALPALRVFEARHLAGISDAGIAHLGGALALERVNLMGTTTGDGAIRVVRGKAQLRELFLGSSITDAGLSRLADLPLFRTWHRRPIEMSLLSGQVHGTFLWVNMASRLSDRGIGSLGALQGLSGLSLFGGGGPFDDRASTTTAAALDALQSLEHLVWLGCTSRLCDDDAMGRIARLPGLRFLMCQDTVAGDPGFGALAESPSIEFIWGRRCYGLTDVGFRRLADMPRLRGVAVSLRSVGRRGLEVLPEFEHLTEIMPVDVTDDGFERIGRCERLEAVHCMYCSTITDRAAEHLGALSRLRSYQAWNTQATDRTLRVLGGIGSLEHVRLSRCALVTDAGLRALTSLPRLESVDLEQLPGVTMDGAAIFPPGVRVNYSAM